MLTTDYDEVYIAIATDKDYLKIIADFGVVLPISEVLSASLYREDIHSTYFQHEDPPDPIKGQLNPVPVNATAQGQMKPDAKDKLPNERPVR